MKLALRKKNFTMKKSCFQSIISLHAPKLALNKSMRASDNEQGINKLALASVRILLGSFLLEQSVNKQGLTRDEMMLVQL